MSERIRESDEISALPHQLERKFIGLRNTLRRITITEWVLAGVLCLLLSLLLFILWDRFSSVKISGRAVMFLLGLTGFAVLGPLRYYSRVWNNRSRSSLSRLIKKQMPRFGDRLQGVLELRKQDSHDMHFSPELSEAALGQIAKESESIDFKLALPKDYRKILLLSLVPLLLILIVLGFLQPKQTKNATARYFLPLADISRFTVIKFQDVPNDLYIAKDESYRFTANLKNADEIPTHPKATLRVNGYPTQFQDYDSGYQFTLPPLSGKKVLHLKAGDAIKKVTLHPTPRPRVDSLSLIENLPAYLQLPEREQKIESQLVRVLEGTSGRLKLTSTSHLDSVKSETGLSFVHSKNSAESNSISLDQPADIAFSLVDSHGLESAVSTQLSFRPKKDQASKTSLNAPQRELIILPHETIDLHLSAQDDFGVQELGLLWHPLGNEEEQQKVSVSPGKPDATRLENQYAFNPEVLNLSPNTYSLYATSKDYYPEREEALSSSVTVHLLSLEAHADHLRRELTELLDSLDETYQDELALYFENQRLEETELLQNPELNNRLKDSLNGEKLQIKKLTKQHETSVQLLQDSFRNTQLLRSTKRAFAVLSEELKEISQNGLPEVQSTLASAIDPRHSEDHAKKQLSLAIISQKAALDKLQEAIKNAREADREFESSTFIHRLQELARKEKEFASSLWKSYPRVLGETPRELDPELRASNKVLGDKQSTLSQDLHWIEEDLRHFANRSEKEHFMSLADTISSSDVYEEMISISEKVNLNHRYRATTTAVECSLLIDSWAKKLASEASSSSQAGGAGGGGSGSEENEQDTEFMLRIMEIIRKQKDLRGKTRAIQQMKSHE